jgi:hypothetical protein
MDIHIGWLELLIICGAFVGMAWANRGGSGGGLDTVPGNSTTQFEDPEPAGGYTWGPDCKGKAGFNRVPVAKN